MEPTGNYKLPKKFIRAHDGECYYSGAWHVKLGGRHITFAFRNGSCPLDTLKVPKVANPTNCDDYEEKIREDAIFWMTAMFDRDDVRVH